MDTYVNHTRKHLWVDAEEQAESRPKADPHQKKVMLSLRLDVYDIVHFELLYPNTTITTGWPLLLKIGKTQAESHSNAAAAPKDLFSARQCAATHGQTDMF